MQQSAHKSLKIDNDTKLPTTINGTVQTLKLMKDQQMISKF